MARTKSRLHPGFPLKLVVVLTLLLAIPVTVLVSRQQQNLQQEAASSYPSVTGMSVNNKNISVLGAGSIYKLYIHGTEYPAKDDKVDQLYIASNNLDAHTFYFLGYYTPEGNAFAWTPPTTAGTYYIVANAESTLSTPNTTKGCDWNKQAYLRDAENNVLYYNYPCENIGPQKFAPATAYGIPSMLKPKSAVTTTPSNSGTRKR